MLVKIINKFLSVVQYQLVNTSKSSEFPHDFEDIHKNIYLKVKDYTMTSPERVWSLIEATKFVHQNNIQGSIVECGVWKGGSMLAVIETLKQLNASGRELYLYDTFDGMSAPTEHDVDHNLQSANALLAERNKDEKDVIWAYSSLESVKKRLSTTNYNESLINYVKGKVEDTIPATVPDKIAILRLDTDWYESTKHELHHLYPLVSEGGIIIIDDYGHWTGARKAVDEFIHKNRLKIFLSRIDYTARIFQKNTHL